VTVTEKAFNIIGKPNRKVDVVKKITGQTLYAGDIALPRMLHCKILRGIHPHARILSIDPTEAQELPGRMDHRAVHSDNHDERFALSHDVCFRDDAGLSNIIGSGTVKVNSLHRQVVDKLADGLIVEATAEDGTIEAVRVDGASDFAYGVQWHPEYWAASDAPSRRLFEAFADAARSRRGHRSAIAAE